MSVYVDPLFTTKRSKVWPYDQACHMVADTHDELEAMATVLGLRPAWLQQPGKPYEHYDLTAAKRERAVKLGAIEVDRRGMVDVWDRKREAVHAP